MLHLYNYFTHSKKKFSPIKDQHVGMYVCGPTVYGDPHMGHARSAVVFDVLYRYLRYKGYTVRYVRNITDVGHLEDELAEAGEDKLVKQARHTRREPMEVAHYYTMRYRDALHKLGALSPSIEPMASGHIPEQQEYIVQLLASEWAYTVNGSVYFDLVKFLNTYSEYGKLSGKKTEDLLASQRELVKQDEKRSALDFALWKRADPAHLMKWNFPLRETETTGFPGWHLECSVMSEKYLGVPFDIHGGGLDLQFPHHEAEIAQCYARHKTVPANYWLYNNMITIEHKKMSKSLGNFITLDEFFTGSHTRLSRAYTPDVVRFFLMRSHYRSVIDVSDESLFSVARGLTKLVTAFEVVRALLRAAGLHSDEAISQKVRDIAEHAETEEREAQDAYHALCAHMDDDMDTPAAVAALFSMSARIEQLAQQHVKAGAYALAAVYYDFYVHVLGMRFERAHSHCDVPHLVKALLALRTQARHDKNFQLSDALRDALINSGITVFDNPDGTSSWAYNTAAEQHVED